MLDGLNKGETSNVTLSKVIVQKCEHLCIMRYLNLAIPLLHR